MSLSGSQTATHLVPLMRYRDVGIASEWLCAAFGFEPHFAAKAPDGAVFYAELRLGDSMIMLGAAGEPSPDDVMGELPGAAGDANVQSCYVVLDDVDAHYEQARRAGATVTLDIKSDDIGGRGYSCRDLEGHVWNFGTYDPWKGQSNAPRAKRNHTAPAKVPGLTAAIALTVAVSIVSGWYVYGQVRGPGDGLTLERIREALLGPRPPSTGLSTGGISRDEEAAEKQAARLEASRAQRAMAALKEELEQERRAKSDALDAAAQAQAAIDKAQANVEQAQTDALKAQADTQKAQAEAEAAQAVADKAAKSQSAESEAARREAERAQQALAAAARAQETAVALRADLERERAAVSRPAAAQPSKTDAELRDAIAAKDAALKSAQEAADALAKERATKDSALRALADAGARIATLEVELKAMKTQAAQAQLKRMRATSAARNPVKPKAKSGSQQPWPYSEW
ncbi:MAG: hypothetical protein Q7T86_02640 [Hyphomicrobiaceae bacterium]|nr:hypothetical protein [Hyphomicrobiaceae bacterium]